MWSVWLSRDSDCWELISDLFAAMGSTAQPGCAAGAGRGQLVEITTPPRDGDQVWVRNNPCLGTFQPLCKSHFTRRG